MGHKGFNMCLLFFILQVAVGFGAGLSELLHSEPESRMEREEVGHHWE
jgi:hypothetical protein